MKKRDVDSSKPLFFVGLVLKSSERQYLDLLRYLSNRNGTSVIYQCKSLTYLHIVRGDGVKLQAAPVDVSVECEQCGSERV